MWVFSIYRVLIRVPFTIFFLVGFCIVWKVRLFIKKKRKEKKNSFLSSFLLVLVLLLPFLLNFFVTCCLIICCFVRGLLVFFLFIHRWASLPFDCFYFSVKVKTLTVFLFYFFIFFILTSFRLCLFAL